MVKRGYKVLRILADEFIEKMKYDSETRNIYYEDKLISCFYFRTLYSPKHFKTEKHWEAR